MNIMWFYLVLVSFKIVCGILCKQWEMVKTAITTVGSHFPELPFVVGMRASLLTSAL